MRRLAVEAGVPQNALFLDKEAHSTWESMEKAQEIMEQQGWETAMVVSDPFHMFRSLLMAEDAGIDAFGAPALESTTYTVPTRRAFYTSREVLALWWYLLQRTLNPA